MKKFKIILTLFIAIIFSANSFAAVSEKDETYDKLKMMIDIMEIIDSNYVSETKSKDLAVGAIKGVVSSLDPFSQYMEEKAYQEMKNETEGSFSGIGIRIMSKNDYITVVTPIVGTPAFRAGILPEDRIAKINNKDAKGISTDEAMNLMRGKAGTKVQITVSRNGIPEELVFNLIREKIKIETVQSVLLDNGIAYVRLSDFNAQSAADIRKALKDFSKQGMSSIILDLRNNPGGLLDTAIDIISMFIKGETLALTTKGRVEGTKKEYFTKNNGDFADLPFVILVNRGSASASEIVAGAMQDFKRALIIGGNTFGKGSVQTIYPLPDGTALRLTIAKYYLPSGRPINRADHPTPDTKNGITPDVEIKLSIEDEVKLYTQSEMVFSKKYFEVTKSTDSKDGQVFEDEALNKAIEFIKAKTVGSEIEKAHKTGKK